MFKFMSGVTATVAVITASNMIDGVWLAQLMLFGAGMIASAVFLMDGKGEEE
jgi:hypothetical protein